MQKNNHNIVSKIYKFCLCEWMRPGRELAGSEEIQYPVLIQHSTFHVPHSPHTRGVATLPTVMVLGVMALIVAVSVTTLAFTELFISQGSAQSSKAHFYAEAGARDALTKIARNKSYLCSATDCYQIDFSTSGCSLLNDCAKVQVTGTDIAKVVTAKGIMKSSTRTLQVIVALDTDGLITATTWSEVTN